MNVLSLTLAASLSLAALTAHAQQDAADGPPAPPAPPAPAVPPEVAEQARQAAEQARIAIDTGFASVLMTRERVVKGAPYCAQAVHETVQPLADGNRIVHKQASQLCRDGEGRTRQEVDRQGRKMVYLRDPVSGENWLLDPTKQTARYLGGRPDVEGAREQAERQRAFAEREKDYAERQKDYAERMREYGQRMREWAQQHAVALRERMRSGEEAGPSPDPKPDASPNPSPNPKPNPNPKPMPKPAPLPPAPPAPRAVVIAPAMDRQEVRIIQIGTPDGLETPIPPIPAAVGLSAERVLPAAGKPKVETLPARDVEGLKLNGQRLTSTIEAGKVGNEKPIVITTEVWTSPDLHLTVSSLQKDPRSGEQNYQLKNIRRGEPDATLMKVPADYRRVGEPKPKKG